jgi:type IV secretory pathway VirB6-like protein
VNEGKEVEFASHQVMKCILCYNNVVNIPNARTKKRKGLITYYKTYGIMFFLKTCRCKLFYNCAKNLKKKLTMKQ